MCHMQAAARQAEAVQVLRKRLADAEAATQQQKQANVELQGRVGEFEDQKQQLQQDLCRTQGAVTKSEKKVGAPHADLMRLLKLLPTTQVVLAPPALSNFDDFPCVALRLRIC